MATGVLDRECLDLLEGGGLGGDRLLLRNRLELDAGQGSARWNWLACSDTTW